MQLRLVRHHAPAKDLLLLHRRHHFCRPYRRMRGDQVPNTLAATDSSLAASWQKPFFAPLVTPADRIHVVR